MIQFLNKDHRYPDKHSMILESLTKTKHPKAQRSISVKDGKSLSKVEIFTSTYCGYCNAAKGLLKNKGVEFVEVDLTSDHELRIALVEKHNWRTVPIIIINDNLVGGYDELVALERKGELDQLLEIDISD